MDRIVTYPSANPRVLDILKTGQNDMVGLAKLSEATLGVSTAVTGFAVTQTSPASLSVLVGSGQVYNQQQLEASAISNLSIDSHQIVKQGMTLDPTTVAITPPLTPGYSINVLIEVQYLEVDDTPILLNYYNASNPLIPLTGPGNSGTAQTTRRAGTVSIQTKYGVPAASGSQATPLPDAGWAGVAVVTVAYGQTSITSGNIAVYTPGPFIPTPLTGVPAGVLSGKWVYAAASGTDTYTASLFSTPAFPAALTSGMEILVLFLNTNTGTSPTLNVNALGAVPIIRSNGAKPIAGDLFGYVPLVYSGTLSAWVVNGFVASDILAITKTLSGTRTYYVNVSTGSDSNDGLSATVSGSSGPFATINAALNKIAGFNLNGFNVTVNVADGTYGQVTPPSTSGSGTVFLVGNTTTPANCVISVGTGACFAGNGGNYDFNGFKVTSAAGSGTDSSCGFRCGFGAFWAIHNIEFGAVQYAHMSCDGATIQISGNIKISGSAPIHAIAGNGGFIKVGTLPIYTISASVTFSTAFVVCNNNAVTNLIYSSMTLSGGVTVTGQRYSANTGGQIITNGGGASYYPGSTAGTPTAGAPGATGGVYS